VTTDTNGCIRDWNNQAGRFFGYDEDDFFGKNICVLCPQESLNGLENLLQRALDQGGCQTELLLKYDDGKRVMVEVGVVSLHSTEGEQRLVFLFRDDAAEPSVHQLLREQETLASIGAAAPSLAHQLGNPINGISATVQLLEHFLSSNDSPPIQPMLSSVRDLKGEVQRLTVLLNAFKTIAAPQKLAPARIDVQPLIRRAASTIKKSSVRQNIQISIACDADLPQLNGDVEKLAQAFVCVLENAVEAMPKGGHLEIKAYRSAQLIGVEVIDTGPGIPPGIKPFEPFASTKSERSGLGLFITQQIVLAHNGAITCLSTAGAGTTVQMTFPAVES
ncbi:MAG: two-component system sensor histidine kinase NtrB, partial [Candidatus Binatia bacterium]